MLKEIDIVIMYISIIKAGEHNWTAVTAIVEVPT